MSQSDLQQFRKRCGQFRWLAIFMVVSVGALLALIHVVSPAVLTMRDPAMAAERDFLPSAIFAVPTIFYLFAVWSIGHAMGELSKGRLFQPTVANALRRVGLALGIGGLISVFGVTNILRVIEGGRGGFAYFDVPGMTLGMIGGALFLLGRVVDQAGRVQAELDEMI